jgi:hypothetical protein
MENPCLKCKCNFGEIKCDPVKKCASDEGCPVLIQDVGECCPRCGNVPVMLLVSYIENRTSE